MSFSPRMEAFRVSTRAIGIDLMRSVYTRNLGTYVSSPVATYRAGMLVELDGQQQIQAAGTDGDTTDCVPFGWTKYTKANTLYATVVDEAVTLNGVVASNLKHANLWNVSSAKGVKVASAAGVVYTETTDYTVNYTNGQVTRVVSGTGPADGETVYVTYQYQVTEQELKFEGRNFWNFLNDVDIQNGLISVITDWSIIFTTQYDPTAAYAVNNKLYAGSKLTGTAGLVSKTLTSNPMVGRVFQVPTADDPFLGIVSAGGPSTL